MSKKFPEAATMLITKLSEEDRKSVEEQLNMLQEVMRNCEVYLRDYMKGNQNAFKFLTTTGWLHGEIQETAKLLMGLHGLPYFPSFWGYDKSS